VDGQISHNTPSNCLLQMV